MARTPEARRIYSKHRADITPRQLALLLTREELRRRRLGVDGILSPTAWRDIVTVGIYARRAPERCELPRTRDELVQALDYLVEHGLVEEVMPESRVTPTRPQLYRWSRAAASDVLARFGQPTSPRTGVCAAEDCFERRAPGSRYCGRACAHRMRERIAAGGEA